MAPLFHAEIEATNHCNTRCLHCPHEAISRPRGAMSWDTYTTIVDKIRRHVGGKPYSLSYSGMGEPMLNPLIYKFIRHVAGEATTSFATNASALTEDNVRKLRDAGLDHIYLSFNGDEPEVYSKMMGGLSFERVLTQVRKAVALCQGSPLKINANVSITKANRDRITRIKELLEREGVDPSTFSLCHSRGGNLKDPEVCDTPAMPVERDGCDVLRHTLFIDWRGRAMICDHDLHGEYGLGDVVSEPLETILERRRKLLEAGLDFKICRECNDLMRISYTPLLASGAGGYFRTWIYDLYKDEEGERLSEATPAFKWVYQIHEKENRVDRLVNRLLAIEKSLQGELAQAKAEHVSAVHEHHRVAQRVAELDEELALRDQQHASMAARIAELDQTARDLDQKVQAMRRTLAWRLSAPLRALRRRV